MWHIGRLHLLDQTVPENTGEGVPLEAQRGQNSFDLSTASSSSAMQLPQEVSPAPVTKMIRQISKVPSVSKMRTVKESDMVTAVKGMPVVGPEKKHVQNIAAAQVSTDQQVGVACLPPPPELV